MMPVKLVIFDLDGTLVDTSVDICNSLNVALAGIGIRPLNVSETVALVGEGLDRLIEKVLSPHGLMDRHEEVVQAFRAHYSEHLTDFSLPYPGVQEALKELRLSGIKMAVLSNKMQGFSERLLNDLELDGRFDLIAGSDTVPEKKPSPLAVQFILEQTGTPPEEAVMLGDSNYDIDAARGAGVTVVAAAWGFRERESLKRADHLIDSISELPRLIAAMK